MKSRGWKFAAAAVIIAAIPGLVFASAADNTPTALDAIRQLFGVDPTSFWNILKGGGQPTLIANVSGVVNTAALTVAVAVMVLTGITGVMQSAHEGNNVLGQRYSALWVPIRWVLTIGLLLPLAGGYSAVQLLVLRFGSIGSGLADQAWGMSSNAISNATSAITAQQAPANRDLVNQMYLSAVCASRLNKVSGDANGSTAIAATPYTPETVNTTVFGYDANGNPQGGGSSMVAGAILPKTQASLMGGVSFDGAGDLQGVNGICGRAVIQQPGFDPSIAQTTQQQYQNLVWLQNSTADLADRAIGEQMPEASVRQYLSTIEAGYQQMEQQRVDVLTGAVAIAKQAEYRQDCFSNGQWLCTPSSGAWVSAGAYYMAMAGGNNTLAAAASTVPHYTAPRMDQLPPAMQADLMPYLDRAARQAGQGPGGGQATASAMPGGTVQQLADGENSSWAQKIGQAFVNYTPAGMAVKAGVAINQHGGEYAAIAAHPIDWLSSLMTSHFDGWFKSLRDAAISPNQDPVVALQALGQSGITICEVVFGVGIIISMALLTAAPVVFAVLSGVIGPIFLVCIIFAFLLPAIPYTLWMFGVLGWVVMLIEAVAVAPLWAASHVFPEGEGWAGQRAQQGYMLLIGLVARPLLMVIGLVSAMLVMRFIMLLVGATFFTFMDTSLGNYSKGLVTLIVMLMLYGAIAVTVIRRSFALIHIIPDQALNWIGHAIHGLGEMDAHRELEQATGTGVAALVNAGRQLKQEVDRGQGRAAPSAPPSRNSMRLSS